MTPNGGETINKYVGDFLKKEVDNYLHIHKDVAEVLENKIKESERERKAMAGVTKLARERAKKANLHNRKLRDCRIHFSDAKNERKEESSIFITEGDSASGSITKSRDVNTQAVFSLRGKPLNSFGLTKKVVYENEEFNLLQAALDIEDGLDSLRYNKVIVATDADVDGMHIRLLIITFFLQFFPDLIKKGHVYVLQTPLFRVRNKRTKIKNKQAVADADAKLGSKEKRAISSRITVIAMRSASRRFAIWALILKSPDSKDWERFRLMNSPISSVPTCGWSRLRCIKPTRCRSCWNIIWVRTRWSARTSSSKIW